MKSRDSLSDLPPEPPYGLNWGHKIANFVFLPDISFILAFRALEYIKRYWESICDEPISALVLVIGLKNQNRLIGNSK